MKHRRDRLILVATVLDHQTRDDEQVRRVGDFGARTPLTFVDRLRQGDGATEAVGKDGRRALHLPDPDGTRGELSSRNLRDFARPRNHAIRVTPSHPVRREALHMDVALNAFNGVDTAAEAYADARDRSAPTGHWQEQVGLVEHHEDGHPVLRGTFAGHYVDVDEAAHTSEEGAAKGWRKGALAGFLLTPAGFAARFRARGGNRIPGRRAEREASGTDAAGRQAAGSGTYASRKFSRLKRRIPRGGAGFGCCGLVWLWLRVECDVE